MSIVAVARAASVLKDEFDRLRLYPWLTVMVPLTAVRPASTLDEFCERFSELVLRTPTAVSKLEDELE